MSETGKSSTNLISPQALMTKLLSHEAITLIDVRTPEEHRHYNIGGISIPISELPKRLQELDQEAEIIVYCQFGKRSGMAAQLLQQAHFKNVKSLEGGMMAYLLLQGTNG